MGSIGYDKMMEKKSRAQVSEIVSCSFAYRPYGSTRNRCSSMTYIDEMTEGGAWRSLDQNHGAL